ncbi:MAG: hypothetical protein AAGA25_16160 [Planctomycetota bacterium]
MKNVASPWLWIALLAAASSTATWSFVYLNRAKGDELASRQQMTESLRYAKQINEAEKSPSRISNTEMEVALLARLVEQAADEASIDRHALDRIWPQPARRIGDSPYQRKTTQLVVRNVSLQQVITFLHELIQAESALSVDQLRLSAPPGSLPTLPPSLIGQSTSTLTQAYAEDEFWTLEASVSHLLYQPTTANSSVAKREP